MENTLAYQGLIFIFELYLKLLLFSWTSAQVAVANLGEPVTHQK